MSTKNKINNQVELYAGTLLLDDRDRVFLIKEEDRNEISKGRWNIPGGVVKPYESLVDAARRNTKVETGYNSEITTLIGSYKCVKKEKEWVFVVFSARSIGEKMKISSPSVKKGKWFEKSEIARMNSDDIVHPDMQLVYNIAIEERGLPIESVKYIDYNIQ